MRKIPVLLMLLLTILLSIGLSSCFFNKTPGYDNSYNPDYNKNSFKVDLAGYIANISNANALGISKVKTNAPDYRKKYRTNANMQYSNKELPEESENKNYIVMTTEEYKSNNPEVDETGLSKVTFTKIITENVTTKTTGIKYFVAKHGSISIPAVEGFAYSVYYNDSLVYEKVHDNDEKDKAHEVGIIKLDNLIDKMTYKVEYEGIGEEITITQQEIDGEVDKLYVTDEYTFVSFVPEGESQRPDNNGEYYNNYRDLSYDQYHYFTHDERQSYVIHNATGYVYDLKDFPIEYIYNGLVYCNSKYYDMKLNQNGELDFVQVVRNETISVIDIFKDKYGNKYVQNNHLNGYDEENNTTYFTKTTYLLSKEGIVLHIEYDDIFDIVPPEYFKKIEKINADLTSSPILENETFEIGYYANRGISAYKSGVYVSHIKNGYLYMYSTQGGAYSYFTRINTSTLESEGKSYGVFGSDGGEWNFDCLKSAPLNANTVLIWTDYSGTSKLYSGNVWGENCLTSSLYKDNFSESNLTVLIENCYPEPCWEFDISKLYFRYTSFTETVLYKIIYDESGNLKAVNSATYIAPELNVVTLQPLNR